eukprot:CCRYP_008459-RB/>CCRYP_008459-RB protein AED:0.08 eAED:0.08 QI:254/0.8/0.83/1/0.6/0.5/6/1423/499
MRLVLSTAALSVATGHTLLTPSLRAGLDSQVQQDVTAAGAECLFVNSFKVGSASASKTHDARSNAVDTGILSCPSLYTCVEDPSSSMGGRCVSLSGHDGFGYEELYHDGQLHRSLVACTFANNTPGIKCEGTAACFGIDANDVLCGSCNGFRACKNAYYSTIGEVSCNGDNACSSATNVTVGEGSCIGQNACSSVYKTTVGQGSCNGYKACHSVQTSIIGDGSCVGNTQCSLFSGTIGDRSCTGDSIVDSNGYTGRACYAATGTIGNDSCYETGACYVYLEYKGESCLSSRPMLAYLCSILCPCSNIMWHLHFSTSTGIYTFTVGNNSCRAYSACYYLGDIMIGDNSCNAKEACYSVEANVGDSSCNANEACRSITAPIGDCLCNLPQECINNAVDKSYNGCVTAQSPTNAPSKSPTGQPTKSPTGQPTKSPTDTPTNSPTKEPTASPVDVSSALVLRYLTAWHVFQDALDLTDPPVQRCQQLAPPPHRTQLRLQPSPR